MTVPTLVLGAGGLIGSSVCAALHSAPSGGHPLSCHTPQRLPWSRPEELAERLGTELADFARLVPVSGGSRWRAVWAAGRATVATSQGDADAEVEAFRGFLDAVDAHLDPKTGRLLLVSSAGALYAGSQSPPFDEETGIAPISPYGISKQAQEDLLVGFVARTGATGIAARVANVYGARQDLTKQQGLISLLCDATLSRRPVRIFVPLDTRRHFVWADDAGRAIVNLLDAVPLDSGDVASRVVVAGRALTVGEIIARVKRVVGVTPPHLVAQTKEARMHPVDLRLRTQHPDELGLLAPTPLEVGIARTWRAALDGRSHR